MEIDGNRLHPGVVSVSGIIHISFENLRENKKKCIFEFLSTCLRYFKKCLDCRPWTHWIGKGLWCARGSLLSPPGRQQASSTPLRRTHAGEWATPSPQHRPSPAKNTNKDRWLKKKWNGTRHRIKRVDVRKCGFKKIDEPQVWPTRRSPSFWWRQTAGRAVWNPSAWSLIL